MKRICFCILIVLAVGEDMKVLKAYEVADKVVPRHSKRTPNRAQYFRLKGAHVNVRSMPRKSVESLNYVRSLLVRSSLAKSARYQRKNLQVNAYARIELLKVFQPLRKRTRQRLVRTETAINVPGRILERKPVKSSQSPLTERTAANEKLKLTRRKFRNDSKNTFHDLTSLSDKEAMFKILRESLAKGERNRFQHFPNVTVLRLEKKRKAKLKIESGLSSPIDETKENARLSGFDKHEVSMRNKRDTVGKARVKAVKLNYSSFSLTGREVYLNLAVGFPSDSKSQFVNKGRSKKKFVDDRVVKIRSVSSDLTDEDCKKVGTILKQPTVEAGDGASPLLAYNNAMRTESLWNFVTSSTSDGEIAIRKNTTAQYKALKREKLSVERFIRGSRHGPVRRSLRKEPKVNVTYVDRADNAALLVTQEQRTSKPEDSVVTQRARTSKTEDTTSLVTIRAIASKTDNTKSVVTQRVGATKAEYTKSVVTQRVTASKTDNTKSVVTQRVRATKAEDTTLVVAKVVIASKLDNTTSVVTQEQTTSKPEESVVTQRARTSKTEDTTLVVAQGVIAGKSHNTTSVVTQEQTTSIPEESVVTQRVRTKKTKHNTTSMVTQEQTIVKLEDTTTSVVIQEQTIGKIEDAATSVVIQEEAISNNTSAVNAGLNVESLHETSFAEKAAGKAESEDEGERPVVGAKMFTAAMSSAKAVRTTG